jgi:hypothetical protein
MAAKGETNSVEMARTFHVLAAEYARIWPEKEPPSSLDDYYGLARKNGQAALCLSGGGIRSGAFGLGILQALSRARLLTGFHYLSTVSGGGYIGAWLQRWIYERGNDAGAVMAVLEKPVEPDEIRHLRENSNFITPRVGLESNDTWAAVAISVRNILLNWLLFVPLLMLIALTPNLFHDGIASIRDAALHSTAFLAAPLGIAMLAIGWATFATVRLLPSYRPNRVAAQPSGDLLLQRRIVLPLVLWAVAATHALAIERLGPLKEVALLPPPLGGHGLDLAIFTLAGLLGGLIAAALTLRDAQAETLACNWTVWLATFVFVTLWIALGAFLFSTLVYEELDTAWGPIVLTAAAPVWMLTGTLLGAIMFVGFRSMRGPSVLPDEDREWVARLSAVKLKWMLFWMVLAPSVLLINGIPGVKSEGGELSWPGLVTAITGVIAVAGGRSQQSGGVVRSAGNVVLRYLPLNAIVTVATLIFIAALLMIAGLVEAMAAGAIAEALPPLWTGLDPYVVAHLLIGALLIGSLFYFGSRISVNRFSLNGLYRNRLSRAFLGAARPVRDPDPFTGFDAGDNVRMNRLVPNVAGRGILYPVINVALNVTATENLAWQERKAEPFIFTPLYCGSGMLSDRLQRTGGRPGAYVDTALYASGEHDSAIGDTGGVTLATAMSLSGAAATPNMGYYSSPATSFLMTLFNVRLGAWLPNPARAATLGRTGMARAAPRNSIGAIWRELRGATDDRGRDIYLSDGGHFENLGLYEMVRRRCKYLLVSDAGADPKCALKDLGNAVRKVKIDFDVDIDFPRLRLAGREAAPPPADQQAWALGTVRYPDGGEGRILYLKPSFYGEGMPADVVAYARENTAFPHESTADQFFSESQFESYRRLGDHLLSRLLFGMALVRNEAKRDGPATMEEFFDAVAKIDADPDLMTPGRAPPAP